MRKKEVGTGSGCTGVLKTSWSLRAVREKQHGQLPPLLSRLSPALVQILELDRSFPAGKRGARSQGKAEGWG